MSAFCCCGHHADEHNLQGECMSCDCMEFEPSELVTHEEAP